MDLIQIIFHAIDRIVTVFTRDGNYILTGIEDALRVPLQELGLRGAAETAAVAMVPILTAIAVWKLFRGIFRGLLMILLLIFIFHALLPLEGELPALFRDVASSV